MLLGVLNPLCGGHLAHQGLERLNIWTRFYAMFYPSNRLAKTSIPEQKQVLSCIGSFYTRRDFSRYFRRDFGRNICRHLLRHLFSPLRGYLRGYLRDNVTECLRFSKRGHGEHVLYLLLVHRRKARQNGMHKLLLN